MIRVMLYHSMNDVEKRKTIGAGATLAKNIVRSGIQCNLRLQAGVKKGNN